MEKYVKKIYTNTNRMKFSWNNLRKWIYSVEKSNPHYSSENYYTYYVKRCFLGKLTLKKVTVYFD